MPTMSADQIISLTASIGACVAAIATFLTVWQMAKQRKASYKPELVLGSGDFDAKADVNFGALPRNWKRPEAKPIVGITTFTLQPNTFGLPLANIGLGTARNISISWEFEIENTATKISNFAKEAGFDDFLSYNRGTLTMRSPSVGSFWNNQKDETMDYILPASIPGSILELELPDAYRLLVSAAVSLNFSPKMRELGGRPELLEPPPLSVTLSFEDIGGKRHAALFHLYVDIRGVNMNEFSGYVETRRRR
jgi:hypothetical protein